MEAFTDLMTLIASNIWVYGGSFVVVLSILVIVHEWGHYAVARACGVKIDEFSVGFGRKLFGFKDRNGTEWKVCMLPLGGYVKMFGDADAASAGQTDTVQEGDVTRAMTEDERKGAFFSKPLAQRAAIVFAGPAINYIFAILLLAGLYVYQGKQIVPPVASAIHVGEAGDKSGILPGDRILSINNQKINNFDLLRKNVMLALDTPMAFTIERNGKIQEMYVTPKRIEISDRFGFKHERGYLGVVGPTNGFSLKNIIRVDGVDTGGDIEQTRAALLKKIGKGSFRVAMDSTESDVDEVIINPGMAMNQGLLDPLSKNYEILVPAQVQAIEYVKYGLLGGLFEAAYQSYSITADSLYAIGQMINGTRSASELGGLIRIGAIAGDMAHAGLFALITFTALLSINLGMINLFPVPMLDGGHLAFYAAEAIRGKPLSDRVQEYAFRFGLVFLVFLMAFANLNDIIQLIL